MDKYSKGQCHTCLEETDVRWKNIYHMGSEGLWICWKCEKEMLLWIGKKRHKSIEGRMREKINKKIKLNIDTKRT